MTLSRVVEDRRNGRDEYERVGGVGGQLDYSAHAWESFTAITLAYVFLTDLTGC